MDFESDCGRNGESQRTLPIYGQLKFPYHKMPEDVAM